MSDIVIRVENLSKRYVLKHASGRASASGDGLRHALQDAVSAPFRRAKAKFERRKEKNADPISTSDFGLSTSSSEDFYALKDVTFEVRRGEVLGIIGRNGAGKSTLLKILSRITEPTSGRIGIKGRVASLLEVGTGFHPELTGRENIYLNGAILGMSRTEVRSKFDEIVAFAEIGKFLDTPVKRYSSGMYVRLAFAVAAHLDPEILIVDEVLAVGDAEFQKKCLGKMQDVACGGRTVLFVSHNMPSVMELCSNAVSLSAGTIAEHGTPPQVVTSYLRGGAAKQAPSNPKNRPGSGEFRLTGVRCMPEISAPHGIREFSYSYEAHARSPFIKPFVIFEILDETETIIARCDTRLTGDYLDGLSGAGTVIMRSPWLKPGRYTIAVTIDSGHGFVDVWQHAAGFQVDGELPYQRAVSTDSYKTGLTLSDFSSKIVHHESKCAS